MITLKSPSFWDESMVVVLRFLQSFLTILAAMTATIGANAAELAEFSLEALLAVELDQMAISGIHHTHDQGEWMVGYKYMGMGMDGIRDGTRARTDGQVLAQGYMVTPTDMYMEMHMLSVMYGVTDRISLMAMVPYQRKTMGHIRMDGVRFNTKSRGIGDISLSALVSIFKNSNHRLIGIGGIRFPTGSIDETDFLPGMMMGPATSQRLPYPMQLGSGSFDVKLGSTYIGQVEGWSWGVHSSGIVRTHENKHDYRLGNEYEVSAWGAAKIFDWASTSLQLKWGEWFDITGADPRLNAGMVPTADPELRAGQRIDLLMGLNVFADRGRLKGLRVGLEAGLPVYQRLDGPQLETDWLSSLTIEWTF